MNTIELVTVPKPVYFSPLFNALLESKCGFFKYYTHRLVQDGRAEGMCLPPPIKITTSC